MIKQADVSVTKQANGSYECAVMLDSYRASKVYYGYTKRESIRLFVTDVNAVLTIQRITQRDRVSGHTHRRED